MLSSAALRLDERVVYGTPPSRSPNTVQPTHAAVIPLPTRTVAVAPAHQPSVQNENFHPISLHLLGGFRLLVNDELVQLGRAGQRLLAMLACRGRQATRSQIAHALWPDTRSSRAHANLRTALYRLQRSCPVAVHATSTYIQLSVGIQIDFERVTKLANRILGDGLTVDGGLLTEVTRVNLYDDLLPDWDDDWLGDHQYRYRQLRLAALETLSLHLAAAGHHGAAVQAALAAVHADALRDSAHETLIRACLAQGNRHEAYTHYATYRRILRDELGLDPPPAIGGLLTSV